MSSNRIRKSHSNHQQAWETPLDRESIAQCNNENMFFRVYSAGKLDLDKQDTTYPNKFRPQHRKQYTDQKQQQSGNLNQNNLYEIIQLRKRNGELQSRLQKYRSKLLEASSRIKQLQGANFHYEQFNDGLVVESEDNIRKFEQYIGTMNTEFKQKNTQLNEQVKRTNKDIQTKKKVILDLQDKLLQTQEEFRALIGQLTNKNQELLMNKKTYEQRIKQLQKQALDKEMNKVDDLNRQITNLKERNESIIKEYEQALSAKQQIILKMSKFNNEICEKMLAQKHQFQQYSSEQINMLLRHLQKGEDLNKLVKNQQTLREAISKLDKQNAALRQSLKITMNQNEKAKSRLEQNLQRIKDLQELIFQKDRQLNQYRSKGQQEVGIAQVKARYEAINGQKDRLIKKLQSENQVWREEVGQLSKELRFREKVNESKGLGLESNRLHSNSMFSKEYNAYEAQRLRKQLIGQQEVNKILRQRIKSAEHLRLQNNTLPPSSATKSSIDEQIKIIGKAFNQLSHNLEQIMHASGSNQSSPSPEIKKIERATTTSDKRVNLADDMRMREILASQRENQQKLQNKLISGFQRKQSKRSLNSVTPIIGNDSIRGSQFLGPLPPNGSNESGYYSRLNRNLDWKKTQRSPELISFQNQESVSQYKQRFNNLTEKKGQKDSLWRSKH